jgi:hypothetical protein
MSYPVLAPGTLVKPQIGELRFRWLLALRVSRTLSGDAGDERGRRT